MQELIAPLLVAIAVAAVVLLPFAGSRRAERARWAGPAALGLGFSAGFLVRAGWSAVPPGEQWHWLGPLALLAALAAALQCVDGVPRVLRVLVVLAAIGLFSWLVVPRFVDPPSARLGWRLATAFTLLVLWTAPAWVTRSMHPRTTALALWAHATGLAIFLVTAHTALLGLVAGILAAVMGVFVVAALWRPDRPYPQTVTPVAAALALGLALTAFFYATGDLGHTAYLLAGSAPLALAVSRLARLERLGGWRAGILQIVLVLIPVGVAILLALRAEAAAASESGGYEDYYYD